MQCLRKPLAIQRAVREALALRCGGAAGQRARTVPRQLVAQVLPLLGAPQAALHPLPLVRWQLHPAQQRLQPLGRQLCLLQQRLQLPLRALPLAAAVAAGRRPAGSRLDATL